MAALITGMTCSCDKLPKNGDLEGNWQLVEIGVTDENKVESVEHVKDKKIFWVFQQDLLCIHFYNYALLPKEPAEDGTGMKEYSEFFGRFNHQGNTLNLTSLYVHDTRSTDRLLEADSRLLESSGIIGNHADYTVVSLNKESMTLRSGNTRLTFRIF
ncbi:MAG: lipocalin-like domain-containing protein [Clostridium sp.]|nr:lipocalin-like domain-containing protein [Clostridium sp.]